MNSREAPHSLRPLKSAADFAPLLDIFASAGEGRVTFAEFIRRARALPKCEPRGENALGCWLRSLFLLACPVAAAVYFG